jgi:Tfp pilus assembly protein PilF
LPSHASILTGLHPPEHGLRVPGVGALPNVATLATALKAAGYRTGAFVANHELSRDRGLGEGFERYDASPPAATAKPQATRSTPRFRRRAFADSPHAGTRRGEEVTDAALAWLAEVTGAPKRNAPASIADRRKAAATGSAPAAASPLRPKRPFFLWVQLADPAFRDSPEHTNVGGSQSISAYDAEVAYMDLQVGRILAFLSTHGLRERTMVAVVGSHGLELGADAGADPGIVLSDETLRIPAILNWAGRIPEGTRVSATLNHTAMAPTIAELAGCGAAFPAPVAARSVAGALLGGPESASPAPASSPAYVETLWPHHAYGLPPLTGWTDANWRFVKGQRVLPRGAGATAEAPSAEDAAATLAAIEASFHAVGAAQPATPAAGAAFTLPAGWDRGEFVALWQRVALRMRTASAADESLLADCRRLVEGRPDYAPFQTWLGIAHSLHKQLAEAVVTQRRALELAPGTPHILNNLGLAYLEASDLPKAIDKLEDAYLAKQDDPEFRDNLAVVLMNTGVALAKNKAFNDSMACMTRVLLLQPDNPVAHVNMGSVYQGMGRNDLATASYRRALELSPGFTPAKRALEALKEPQ